MADISSIKINNNLYNVKDNTARQALDNKVDKVNGKGLSTNDFTTEEKNKLARINENIDSSLSNTSENPVQNKIVKAAVDNKVDKVAGKGLSTNDFTNELKTKLENAQEELTFDDMPVEESDNPVKSGGVYTDTSITRSMIASKEEGYDPPKTFGVQWDYSQPSTVLTRIEGAADFDNPSPATSLSGSGSSPFDDIAPWKDMKRYNIIDGEVAYSQDDAGYSETDYDTVVYIPEFYYFSKKDTTNQKWTWSISSEPIEGYEKHPGSGRYVGRFHTSGSGLGVFSKGGVAPLATVTRAKFRIYSHNKGSNWWQIDLATWSAIQMLYLVEFANWNSQNMLGKGNNTGSVKNTGATTGAAYHTIKQTGAGGNMYRWIENPFANLFTFVDGFVASNRVTYISTDNATFSDATSGMKSTDIILPSTNYITSLGYSEECAWAFIPNVASGGNAATHIPDYVESNVGLRVLYVGGTYGDYDVFGIFYFNVYTSANDQYATLGSRLIYIP